MDLQLLIVWLFFSLEKIILFSHSFIGLQFFNNPIHFMNGPYLSSSGFLSGICKGMDFSSWLWIYNSRSPRLITHPYPKKSQDYPTILAIAKARVWIHTFFRSISLKWIFIALARTWTVITNSVFYTNNKKASAI